MTNLKYILLTMLFIPAVGCKKFVAVETPKTELIDEKVFSDNTTANAAMTSIYSQMVNDFENAVTYTVSLLGGLSADEFSNFSTENDNVSLYRNDINPLNSRALSLWSSAYNYIYRANAIVEGVTHSSTLSSRVVTQLKGEALFVRAFWYFYLTNFYGDLPLITATDYKSNAVTLRSPRQEIYEQVIKDLEDASALLGEVYVGTDGVMQSEERVRPNVWAVHALLARVNLYNGDYDDAELQSASVIENNSLFQLVSLDEVFLKNNFEAIWQLQPAASVGNNTPEARNFILNGSPETGTFSRNTTLSQQLLAAFENGDNRRLKWVDSVVVESLVFHYPFKYKIAYGDVTEYSTVFRLAEQYLVRAEARLMKNNLEGAKEDLNAVRARAGLPPITSTVANVIKDAIDHERQVELFSEWGHRWLDIKRGSHLQTIMSTAESFKGGSWSETDQFYPVPQVERNNNPNLSQNEGY